MLTHAAIAAAVLAVSTIAAAQVREDCTVEVARDERFEQDRDAVVQPGERLRSVTSLRGRVVLRSGAEVDEAMAVGGDLVVEPGARVRRTATSVGGDVVLKGDAEVGESAVSLGGEVIRSKEAKVGGNVFAFAVRVGDRTLAETLERKIGEVARCKVVRVRARGAPAGTDRGAAL